MYRGSVAYQSYFGFKLATGLQCMITLAGMFLFIFCTLVYASDRGDNNMFYGLEFIFILISTLLSVNLLVLSSKMIAWKSTTILLVHQIYIVVYIILLLVSRMIIYYFGFKDDTGPLNNDDVSKRFEPLYLIMFTYVLLSIALLGPEPVLKAFRKPPVVTEDHQNNVAYTSEPVLKAFRRKISDAIGAKFKGPPEAPNLAMERRRSPSAEDYLDFDSREPPKDPKDTKKEKRSGSFDDVLDELKKRQAKLQKY